MKLLATLPLIAVLFFLASEWAPPLATAPTDDGLRERGRKIFAGRCAKCHDEDASRKLADGTTLLRRLAASKDPKALLATRLKSMNDEDRRGVFAYIDDLLLAFRASPAARH